MSGSGSQEGLALVVVVVVVVVSTVVVVTVPVVTFVVDVVAVVIVVGGFVVVVYDVLVDCGPLVVVGGGLLVVVGLGVFVDVGPFVVQGGVGFFVGLCVGGGRGLVPKDSVMIMLRYGLLTYQGLDACRLDGIGKVFFVPFVRIPIHHRQHSRLLPLSHK